MKSHLRALLIGGALSLATTEVAAQTGAPTWPEGATAVTEVYTNWILNCWPGDTAPTCIVTQEQTYADQSRHLLINLRRAPSGISSAFLFPPNLDTQAGMTAAIDDMPMPAQDLVLLPCAADGCAATGNLGPIATLALKAGQVLTLRSRYLDGSEAVFEVPLTGLAHSMTRIDAFN